MNKPLIRVGAISFMPRELIFREGDEAREFYLVRSGAVQLSVREGSERRVVATLGKNEIFGATALCDGAPHLVTAAALTATVCSVFPKAVLAAKLLRAPELTLMLCRSVFATLRNG